MPESESINEDEDDVAATAVSGEAAADLEADLAALGKERDELRGLAQRVQADFENYRKRMLREQTDAIGRANAALVEQLLPVLDSAALAVTQLEDADERVRKGIELVFAELVGVLEKAGLERLDETDVAFDPNVNEAEMQEGGPGGEPVVA
ncbi:MAG TPA: nucleotide exchange factor GrpE, partial [Acidimicrobiia bacterium]|nr:nucleotide exchange factor GrpE [Acidimicrobiia bacterium]